ncbi:hypothetical protein [Bacillus wiedmannii]|uniref:hypothetical protein n=1 Tax=Bacillus wiedmannii TaxID=1890302 RepID=UPI00159BD471|nr:hypothetical protein [Bacillus wiedmannii]
MKQKKTLYYCMNKKCGWTEATHKLLEGLKCPKCNGPTNCEFVEKYKSPPIKK